MVEVEGANERLGLSELRATLTDSEEARRGLTADLFGLQDRHEKEVDRVRDEYDRAFNAMEARQTREASRWRDDRDRLQREIERLEREAKDEKKSKKKHKKSVAALELQVATLREEGKSRRAVLSLLSPGVPPLANEFAKHVPDLFAYLRTVLGNIGVSAGAGSEEEIKDRAAAIRFAGRLFEPQHADLLDDLKRIAFDVVDEDGQTIIVSEWERVQRCVWSALRREAEAAAGQQQEVVDEAKEATDAS